MQRLRLRRWARLGGISAVLLQARGQSLRIFVIAAAIGVAAGASVVFAIDDYDDTYHNSCLYFTESTAGFGAALGDGGFSGGDCGSNALQAVVHRRTFFWSSGLNDWVEYETGWGWYAQPIGHIWGSFTSSMYDYTQVRKPLNSWGPTLESADWQ